MVLNKRCKQKRFSSISSALTVFIYPRSIRSFDKFRQYCVNCFVMKLRVISIRWFAIDRPIIKLLSPAKLSNYLWNSTTTTFSFPSSLRIMFGALTSILNWVIKIQLWHYIRIAFDLKTSNSNQSIFLENQSIPPWIAKQYGAVSIYHSCLCAEYCTGLSHEYVLLRKRHSLRNSTLYWHL